MRRPVLSIPAGACRAPGRTGTAASPACADGPRRLPSISEHNIPLPIVIETPPGVFARPRSRGSRYMCGKDPDRNPSSRSALAILVALAGLAAAAPARAGDGLWDQALQTLNLKATPAEPPPAFVERTRPNAAELGYIPTALPHKVSPRAVKTPAEIEAATDALDAAKARQLNPAAAPVDLPKGRRRAKPTSAPAVAD